MTPDQILAFVLAMTAPPPLEPLSPVMAAPGAAPGFPVVAMACPPPLAPTKIERRRAACGRVSGPEDCAAPGERRRDLALPVCTAQSPAPGPVENPQSALDRSGTKDLVLAFLLPDGTLTT